MLIMVGLKKVHGRSSVNLRNARTSRTTTVLAIASFKDIYQLCSTSQSGMVEADTFLHLARPLGPNVGGSLPTTSPLNVIIQPQVSVPQSHARIGGLAHTSSRSFSPSSTMPSALTKTKCA